MAFEQSLSLRIVRLRPYSHIGPRQAESFVSSSFAKQVAEIEAGLREPVVRVGNLDAERDFTDVRDMARAYALASQKAEPGEAYNICSGRSRPVREILDVLIDLSSADIAVEPDPARMRKAETWVVSGDGAKFRQATGWRPSIHFRQTIADTLNYWREQITKGRTE